jgi:hypothetical protein
VHELGEIVEFACRGARDELVAVGVGRLELDALPCAERARRKRGGKVHDAGPDLMLVEYRCAPGDRQS